MFQILHSTFVLSSQEAIIILQILFGQTKNIEDDKELFAEKLNFPRKDTAINNRKSSLMKKQVENLN